MSIGAASDGSVPSAAPSNTARFSCPPLHTASNGSAPAVAGLLAEASSGASELPADQRTFKRRLVDPSVHREAPPLARHLPTPSPPPMTDGLMVYLKNSCPDGVIPIRLDQEAKVFTEKTARCPVIVVDGLAILDKLYPPQISWVFGGQWREYMQRLNSILSGFNKCGIELVFIFDGMLGNTTSLSWESSARRKRANTERIYNWIRERGKEPEETAGLHELPSGLATFTMFALKNIGATVLSSIIDVDKEIANYCHRHHCFGILSDNPNFLLFASGFLFSISSLDFDRRRNSISTVAYSRGCLASKLGLDVPDLVLLASLCGIGLVPREKLLAFHENLTHCSNPPLDTVIPAVANYIQGLQCVPPRDVQYIADAIFPHDPHSQHLLFSSVNYFSLNDSGIVDEDMCPLKVLKPGSGGRFTRVDDPQSNDAGSNQQLNGRSHNAPSHRTKCPISNFNLPQSYLTKSPPPPATSCLSGERVSARVDRSILQLAKRRHIRVENTNFVYNVLVNATSLNDNCLEPPPPPADVATQAEPLASYASCYKRIRQRIYGLLYGVVHSPSSASTTVGRSCAAGAADGVCHAKKMRLLGNGGPGDSLMESAAGDDLTVGLNAVHEWLLTSDPAHPVPEVVEAAPLLGSAVAGETPPLTPPKLETLWLGRESQQSELKTKTLLQLMNCEHLISCIPELMANPKQIAFFCVLHHLCNWGAGGLKPFEVDAFIAQMACVTIHDSHSIKSLPMARIEGRAVQLAFLFVQGVRVCVDANCAVGWAVDNNLMMPWHFFDGKLFHCKYLQAHSGAAEDVLCEKRHNIVDEFLRIKKLVVRGTKFQSS